MLIFPLGVPLRPLRFNSQRCVGWCVALLCWVVSGARAEAGGGPENVFLVFNARSWASRTVANHYIAWRKIPDTNVLELDWGGPLDEISIAAFRQQILAPAIATIQQRQLSDHIDYLVYSSDLPWSVDARAEFTGKQLPDVLNPIGSLTGLTYFAPQVMQHSPAWLGLDSNHYARPTDARPRVPATQGFRNWYGWGSDGALLEAGGNQYLLSTMLAVTSGRGNSVGEALAYLKRSVEADATHPTGTIYYMANDDVRARTRLPLIDTAMKALERLDVRSRRVELKMPSGQHDVQGLMMGIAEFDWAQSHSTIRPGAICENLTSLGGDLRVGAGQTPLTEFLRFGAAGSSGAVVEPYAIQAKFPLPQIQVHYARGCSLAEAFYQSLASPYQLLIVGDPLCQPWATIPEITVAGLAGDEPVRGAVTLLATSSGTRLAEVDRYDWFVDGVHLAQTPRGERVTIDTTRMADGYHELRVVGADSGAIESQGRAVLDFVVDNHNQRASLSTAQNVVPHWGEPLELVADAPGAAVCMVVAGAHAVARIEGAQGRTTLEPRTLGYGPVRLQLVAFGAAGEALVRSSPLRLSIEPNMPLPPVTVPGRGALTPGFVVTPQGKPPKTVVVVPNSFWLADANVRPGEAYDVQGYLDLLATDVYQFHVRHYGSLTLSIDGHEQYRGEAGDYQLHVLPLSLERGQHRLELHGKAGDRVEMEIGFGGPGIRPINGTILQHPVE